MRIQVGILRIALIGAGIASAFGGGVAADLNAPAAPKIVPAPPDMFNRPRKRVVGHAAPDDSPIRGLCSGSGRRI